MTIIERLKKKDIKDIFKKNKINHLYLIGSYSRGEEKENSDIDLLYEESNNEKFSLFDLIKIKNILEKKISKNIDLVGTKGITKQYKVFIDKDKKLIF